MKDWEQYQHQVAELLREVGFTAEVNARIAEANGAVHAIDVVGRRSVAGVDLLWIVECKHWNKPVPIEKVLALRSLVIDLGADRGLLMSESGFQSGAIRTASQKNITLSSLADLRANAADEILAARVVMAEKTLISLTVRVERDLRNSGDVVPRMLAVYAAGLPAEVVEEFATRPVAVDIGKGITEIFSRAEGVAEEDLQLVLPHPDEWQPGADRNVMHMMSNSIRSLTHSLAQGRLGQWPTPCLALRETRAVCPTLGEAKLAWSMEQLIDAVEATLPELGRNVAQQEAKVAQRRRSLPTRLRGRSSGE